jgi:hypothetical protein
MSIDHHVTAERLARLAVLLKSLNAHTEELHRIAAQAREESRRQAAGLLATNAPDTRLSSGQSGGRQARREPLAFQRRR